MQEKVQGKARYINTLLEKAKERQREQDIIMERHGSTPRPRT